MIWLAVLTLGAVASVVAAVGEWRIAKRTGKRVHLWGAAASLALALILTSYAVGTPSL